MGSVHPPVSADTQLALRPYQSEALEAVEQATTQRPLVAAERMRAARKESRWQR